MSSSRITAATQAARLASISRSLAGHSFEPLGKSVRQALLHQYVQAPVAQNIDSCGSGYLARDDSDEGNIFLFYTVMNL